ncbi:MAG: N-methyl-L-tryptophan oxidase [bacterium]|nr:N-methyl-L-tryptophan oxidase [bacterium]
MAYDVLVIGAGAMGSAAAYHAARAGYRVLLLEQFEIDHQMGSSYGYSRIIRYAYTDPVYVRLAQAAYPLWAALETEVGETLYVKTGGIDFGIPGESTFTQTLDSLTAMDIPHERMTAAEAMERFPQFRFSPDVQVMYQADYGALKASRCVLAHVRLAQAHGAELRDRTPVTAIRPLADGVEVETPVARFTAARLILTAGVWAKGLLGALGLELPLIGARCQENYFDPAGSPERYRPGAMPIFIHHDRFDQRDGFYGIPSIDGSGVKIAVHGGDPVLPETGIDYAPDSTRIERVQAYARALLPQVGAGTLRQARICLYTMTPDEDFILDHHPAYPQITIGSPCSGHGFKFSTLIGKLLVELACDGVATHETTRFRIGRFTETPDIVPG